jgi:hypothetical protein
MSETPSLHSEDDKKLVITGAETFEPKLAYIQEVPDIDPAISRKIVRKYDVVLLPLLAGLYLCSSLDKCT